MSRAVVALAGLALAAVRITAAQERDDDARARWRIFYEHRAWPFARVPPGALSRARAAAATMPRGPLAVPPISGTRWQPIGPTALSNNGASTGRVSAIAVHPHDPNTIYVGGATGGVWKTVDGGATWRPLTDTACSLTMGSIAIDPVNPEIVYAGTGEQHFTADDYFGCGVLRSTDGGATWTRLGAGPSGFAMDGARISRVVIAPRTAGVPATTTILAATDAGLFRSTDGGTTWTERLVGRQACVAGGGCIVTDLLVHPANDSLLYAAVHGGGIFESTDRGATWLGAGSGLPPAAQLGRINFAMAPSAPDTMYAAIVSASGLGVLSLWRTTNGAAWSPMAARGASCGQCWYDLYVAVDPLDPATVFLGAVDLYRSRDGGATFSRIGFPTTHPDHHLMVFDPQDPRTVYDANDGGIARSRDGGTTWTSISAGLSLTQFYAGIALHPSDPMVLMGGTQDNGVVVNTGEPVWQFVLGGDGSATAIDRDHPQTRYAVTQDVGGATPYRSDGGAYTPKASGIAGHRDFLAPLVMDPFRPTTLYFGATELYRTTDRGESWSAVSPSFQRPLAAIALSPSVPGVIYAGSSTGDVRVTSDGGATWAATAPGLPDRWLEDLAVDPADWHTAWLVVSGYGSGHVFRTTDAGQHWSDRSANLPDAPVNAVLVDPVNGDIVLVGTDVGVFVSTDAGASWSPLDQGLPHVPVTDLAYNPATAMLVAATYGRGMFALQLNRPLTVVAVPGSRRTVALDGAAAPSGDTVVVVLSGVGGAAAGWTASHGAAAWLTLQTSGGTGTGAVSWTRDPAGLGIGTWVDTITITAPGALDSPVRVVDTLIVVPPEVTIAPAAGSGGSGRVTSSPPGIACDISEGVGGGACTTRFAPNATVTLTAAPSAGSGFLGWSDACTGATGPCAVTVGGPRTAAARFEVLFQLTITALAGHGGGTISGSSAAGPVIACVVREGMTASTGCAAAYIDRTTVTLRADAAYGSTFAEWGGACGGTAILCTVTIEGARSVSARFVDDRSVTTTDMVGALLGRAPVPEALARHLDDYGNRNGGFDVGDLAAWLDRQGSAAAGRPTP